MLLTNSLILYGAIVNQWPIFLVIYGFWLETIIISIFETLKILFAKGENSKPPNITLATQHLLLKLGMLLFYLIFIVVFIGLLHSSKTDSIKILNAVYFRDKFFNAALLSMILGGLLNFIVIYWMELRTNFGAKHFFNFLDARTLTIHLVIVIGTFALEFADKNLLFNENLDKKYVFLSIFILVKTIADLVSIQFSNNEEDLPTTPNNYI
ncbi:MAG: hypothetical protein IPN09_02670 [Bacteroidetes bacterium]|nr:hypothetical protein [Bacteroidota bacterium]